MAIFGNKARAAALCVAILIVLYGTTEVAPIGGKSVRFSGGTSYGQSYGGTSYVTRADPKAQYSRYERGKSAEAAVQLRSERESITGWGQDYDSDT